MIDRKEDIRNRKLINLPDEVRAKLSHQAIDFGTNLKNYIEAVCCYLAEKDKDDVIMIELRRHLNT
jgi:hypothetical protein